MYLPVSLRPVRQTSFDIDTSLIQYSKFDSDDDYIPEESYIDVTTIRLEWTFHATSRRRTRRANQSRTMWATP